MLFFGFLCIFLFHAASAISKSKISHPSGFDIIDLTSNPIDISSFAHEWKLENFVQSSPEVKSTTCVGVAIIGGLEIKPPLGTQAAITRTYTDLQPHYHVTVSFILWTANNWPATDNILIQIDNQTPFVLTPNLPTTAFCGTGERYLNFYGKARHTRDSLTLKISGSLSMQPHPQSSFGISMVTVHLYTDPLFGNPPETINNPHFDVCQTENCMSTNLCGRYTFYQACGACLSSCKVCDSSDNLKCYACKDGFSFDGVKCDLECDDHCIQCYAAEKCLKCIPTKVLDLDETCQDACSEDAIPIGNSFKTCVKPCPSGKFLLWNYTCADSCDPPFIRIMGVNGGDFDFCEFPCRSMEYLDWNGSCFDDCPSENRRIEEDKKFCDETSPQPVEPGSPGSGLSPEVQKEIENIASVNSQAGAVASFGLAITSILSVGNPVKILSGSLKQMLEYTKFLNITHSAKLAHLFSVSDTSSMSLFPTLEMSEELTKRFPNYQLPFMFEKYELDSSFFLNYWDNLFQYGILIGVLFLLTVLDLSFRWLRNIGRAHAWIKRGKVIMINYIVGQYYQEVGDLVFYAGLEFCALERPKSGYDYLSLITPIACLLIGVIIFTVNWRFVQKYSKIKSSRKKSEKEISKELTLLKSKYQSLQILYEEFEDITRSHQAYLLILQTRSILFNIVIVFLSHSPHVQVFLIILTHFIILGYFAIKKPLKSILNLIQMTVFEVSLLVVNLSWLIMAIIDTKNNPISSLRETLSDVVIKTNLVFTFIPLGFFAIQFVLGLKSLIQYLRELKQKRKIKPIQETTKLETSNPFQDSSILLPQRNEEMCLNPAKSRTRSELRQSINKNEKKT